MINTRLKRILLLSLFLGGCYSVIAQNNYCGNNLNNAFFDSNDPNTIEYDNIVSTFHSTMARQKDGSVVIWGEATGPLGTLADNKLFPTKISSENGYDFDGTILRFTGGSNNLLQSSSTFGPQFVILTTEGLYAWGQNNVVIPSTIKSTNSFEKLTTISNANQYGLPIGVLPQNVKMMHANFRLLAIVTCDGSVYILGNANVQGGDCGTGCLNTWVRVKKNSNDYLTDIVAVRGTRDAVFALSSTASGSKLYTWGKNAYLADGTRSDITYATEMTPLPDGKTPKMIEMNFGSYRLNNIDQTDYVNTYHVLTTDGKIYSVGSNVEKQIGDNSDPDLVKEVMTWTAPAPLVSNKNIVWISSSSRDATVHYGAAINALSSDKKIYAWGSNSSGMINGNFSTFTPDPAPTDPVEQPGGLSQDDKIIAVATGGHTTIVIKECRQNYGYVGHYINGSTGGSTGAGYQGLMYTFAYTGRVDFEGVNFNVPLLSSDTIFKDCGYSVDLNSVVSSVIPQGYTLKWFADSTLTTEVENPMSVRRSGAYYPVYVDDQDVVVSCTLDSVVVAFGECFPDVAVNKVGPISVHEGGSATYSIHVTNEGPGDATDILVQDLATANFTATSISCAAGDGWGGTAVCPTNATISGLQGAGLTIPFIPQGGVVTLTISGDVTGEAGSDIVNTATVEYVKDQNLSNNTSTVSTKVYGCTQEESVYKLDGIATVNSNTLGVNGGIINLVYNLTSGDAVPGIGTSFMLPVTYSDLNNYYGVDNQWQYLTADGNVGQKMPIIVPKTITDILSNLEPGSLLDQLPPNNRQAELPLVTLPRNYTDYTFVTKLKEGAIDPLGTFKLSIGAFPSTPSGYVVTDMIFRVYTNNNINIEQNNGGFWLKPMIEERTDPTTINASTARTDFMPDDSYTYRYSAFSRTDQPVFTEGLLNGANRGVTFRHENSIVFAKICPVNIMGTIFNDANGNTVIDGVEQGTNAGTNLYVYLVDENNIIVDSAKVKADGTYELTGTPNQDYASQFTIHVSQTEYPLNTDVLSNPIDHTLPTNWVHTGENGDANSGNGDGTPDGVLSVTIGKDAVTDQNFGIEQLPESDDKTEMLSESPAGNEIPTGSITNNVSGSDPEDGILDNTGTIVITDLPTNGTMYYDGVEVFVGQEITGFDPSKLSFTDLQTGTTNTTFKYAFKDAAGKQDLTPAVYEVKWLWPLPIKLLEFKATKDGSVSLLTWLTQSESNNKGFEVERSLNGKVWSALGFVRSLAQNGESQSKLSYSYTDAKPVNGINYYRLKQIDFDGNFVYSNIQTVSFVAGNKIALYPNPVKKLLTVDGVEPGQVILIYNSIGQVVMRHAVTQKGNLKLNLQSLANGAYQLSVVSDNSIVQTIKFVKD